MMYIESSLHTGMGALLAGVRRIDTPAYWPLLFAGRGAI